MKEFEKLGAFYLGKTIDPGSREIQDELLKAYAAEQEDD